MSRDIRQKLNPERALVNMGKLLSINGGNIGHAVAEPNVCEFYSYVINHDNFVRAYKVRHTFRIKYIAEMKFYDKNTKTDYSMRSGGGFAKKIYNRLAAEKSARGN
ncbi:MAG: hypothetical protein FWG39_00890 [Alphaproteobacteria bacterium]|nr:hypothetical protein [Alphaproteobacteria bacterium]